MDSVRRPVYQKVNDEFSYFYHSAPIAKDVVSRILSEFRIYHFRKGDFAINVAEPLEDHLYELDWWWTK
jgi:hypothetical protein